MAKFLRMRILCCLIMAAALAVFQVERAQGATGKAVLTSLNPAKATAGSPSFIVSIYGSGFVSGSTVYWTIGTSSTPLTPSSITSAAIMVTVSTALIANSGTATITVNNPGKNGGLSNGLSFTINPSTITPTPAPSPLAIATTSIPLGTQGTAYSAALAATGGTTPYSWGLASGALPPGLLLSPTGAISGTPSVSGSFSFMARVTDAAAHTATYTYGLTIGAGATPLSISTASPLPNASASTAYSTSYAALGGTSPYSWTVATGSTLPAGLSLSSTGTLSGTPTTATTYSFSVQVKDAASHTSTKAYSLTVSTTTSSHKVVLTWSAPAAASGVTVTGYSVYRLDVTTTAPSTCPTPTSTSHFTKVGSTASPTLTDTSVVGGHTYCYYATALAGAAESSPSNISTPTKVPSP